VRDAYLITGKSPGKCVKFEIEFVKEQSLFEKAKRSTMSTAIGTMPNKSL
jgi:hypothetical protein